MDILVGNGAGMHYSEDPLARSLSKSNHDHSSTSSNDPSCHTNSVLNTYCNDVLPTISTLPNPTYDTADPCIQYSEPRPESKPEEYIIYKSLNYLPFTTRFHMLQNGSTMKLVDDNPRQSVVITDTRPPPYSNKQR